MTRGRTRVALEVAPKRSFATLSARVRGETPPNPRRTKKPWAPAYAVRRIAWHALDHAWQPEDRTP